MSLARLPHTYPFRLVDTVLESPVAGEGTSGVASSWQGRVLARVSADSWTDRGGPVASPLLLAESIAQAALLLEGGDPEIGRRGFLAGIEGFEATRSPRAGESLSILVRLSARFGAVAKFEGEVRADEETIARGAVLVKRGDGS